MQRLAACCLYIMVAGCATPYEPITLGAPADPVKYESDKAFCLDQALRYSAKPSFGSVASGTITGASGSLSYFPLNPLIPALGAAGGAANEAAKGFDVTGQIKRNVAKNCLHDLTLQDGSALIANPD